MSKTKTHELILMGMLTGILFMGQGAFSISSKCRDRYSAHSAVHPDIRQKSFPYDLCFRIDGRNFSTGSGSGGSITSMSGVSSLSLCCSLTSREIPCSGVQLLASSGLLSARSARCRTFLSAVRRQLSATWIAGIPYDITHCIGQCGPLPCSFQAILLYP